MTSPSVTQASVRPHWLRRLLGDRDVTVEFGSATLTFWQDGSATRMAYAKLSEVAYSAGLLFGTVTVRSQEGTRDVSLGGLRKKDAKRLVGAIRVQQNAETIAEAILAFDRLLESPGYLNHRRVSQWLELYGFLAEPLADLPPPGRGSPLDRPTWEAADRCRKVLEEHQRTVANRNDYYVKEAAERYSDFFASLEAYPLTDRQVEAVLRDEDNVLVVAGAGTGKTSAVVAKVAFLVRSGEVGPDKVLALAFARKAAGEMAERVAAVTGSDVEVRTFHSLGRQVVLTVENEKPTIASVAQHEKELLHWVSRCLGDVLSDPAVRDLYVNFVVYHRYPARYAEDFTTKGDYLKYLRKHEPQALLGEWLKSFEELLIADWLTLNGIKYEYEHPYEHKTASRQRRQYKPDFHLPQSGVYIEHFGIDKQGRTAPGIDPRAYRDGIRWKRQLHKSHGTTLVETYSYERREGTLFQELDRKLQAVGVRPRTLSTEELRRVVEQPEVNRRLVALLADFLTVFKENLWTLQEIRAKASSRGDVARTNSFLELFEVIFERYEDRLHSRQELDFADLIVRATRYVEAGKFKSSFARIVVDEFQDISRGRQRFLQALMAQVNDCRAFCVGDDWQSIYGFTGSDVGIMTSFQSVFGYTAKIVLDRTFRFNDGLVEVSSSFVQRNPGQIPKDLRSEIHAAGPVVHIVSSRENDIESVLRAIDAHRPPKERASVLLLGRYNHSEPEGWEAAQAQYKMLDVQFLTVHKAKGLEGDYVVLVDVKEGRYGFPCEIATDPLLELVVPADYSYEHAEERRIFYVALTRARRQVYLIADPLRRSSFQEELSAVEFKHRVESSGEMAPQNISCPECHAGKLVFAFPRRTKGYAWRCTSRPYCEGRAKNCQVCLRGPLLRSGARETCGDPSCGSHSR